MSDRCPRMPRAARRQKHSHREEVSLEFAVALRVGLVALASGMPLATEPTATQASAPNQFLDVPATFQMMRDASARILNYRAAVHYLREARANLKSARAAVEQATTDRADAIVNLNEARTGLAEAKTNLQTIVKELAIARSDSEARTSEAIAAQQAVADYLPQLYAQQTRVQELQARLDSLEASRPSYFGGSATSYTSGGSYSDADRAERIRREWERVGYDPGHLEEVRRIVESGMSYEAGAAGVEVYSTDYSAEEAAYDAEIESVADALSAEESYLSDIQDELDRLTDARTDAEEAEADARATVRELQSDWSEAVKTQNEAEQWVTEAEATDRATAAEVVATQAELQTATSDEREAEHGVRHFGEGVGVATSTEYYHWNGAHSTGHQLVRSYEASYETPQVTVGLSTGFVSGSITSRAVDSRNDTSGSISHMTDTTLTAMYKNNKKVNDTHYLLSINLPTGKSDASPFASVPAMLARYTTFGEGLNVTPGIEGVHHFNEEDSLTARLTYSLRYGYDSLGYTDGYEDSETKEWVPLAVNRSRVSPGNQLGLELSYLHAGEHEQFYSYLRYNNNSDTTSYDLTTSVATQVRDGDGWEWGAYYNENITARTAWQTYLLWSHDGATIGSDSALNRGMTYYGAGAGLRHRLSPDEHVSLLAQYLRGRGAADSWRTGLGNEDPRRLSVMLGYEKQINDKNNLRLQVERYTLNDRSSGDYNGWSAALFLNRSL